MKQTIVDRGPAREWNRASGAKLAFLQFRTLVRKEWLMRYVLHLLRLRIDNQWETITLMLQETENEAQPLAACKLDSLCWNDLGLQCCDGFIPANGFQSQGRQGIWDDINDFCNTKLQGQYLHEAWHSLFQPFVCSGMWLEYCQYCLPLGFVFDLLNALTM